MKTRKDWMNPPRRCGYGALTLALALGLGGCGDALLEPGMEMGGRIVLDQDVVVADSHGQTITFSARVLDQDGMELDGVTLEWAAENPDVLEALEDGSFRTVSDGASEVVVRIPRSHPSVSPEGYFANIPQARAHVTVEQVARSLMLVEDGAVDGGSGTESALAVVDLWTVDDVVRLGARPADGEGQTVEDHVVSSLVWTSENDSVSVVDADGAVRPVGDGETMIKVTDGGLTGEVRVRVRTTQTISACATTEGKSETPDSACSSLQLTFARGSAGQ